MKIKDAMIIASAKYLAGHQDGTPPYWREVRQFKQNCTKTTELVKSDITDSDNH
jgi:hypothetical protein